MSEKPMSAFSPEPENGASVVNVPNEPAPKAVIRDLVAVDVVADLLKLERDTVVRMAKRRQIPHVRVAKRTIRFDMAEIQAWLDASKLPAVVPQEASGGPVGASGGGGEGDGAGKGEGR